MGLVLGSDGTPERTSHLHPSVQGRSRNGLDLSFSIARELNARQAHRRFCANPESILAQSAFAGHPRYGFWGAETEATRLEGMVREVEFEGHLRREFRAQKSVQNEHEDTHFSGQSGQNAHFRGSVKRFIK
jgi:hypothetical protein